MLTDEEKKKLLDGFQKPIQTDADDENIENDWTETEILEAAKRIMRRMGIEGELENGKKM